jgi:AraC-like DNA-binding protein
MKNTWIRYSTSGEYPKLPHLLYVGTDSVNSPSYCWDGGKRKSEQKCVFQYTIDGYGFLAYHDSTYKVDKGKAFIYDLSDPDSCYFYPPGETKTWSFVYCVFSNFEEAVEQLNSRHGPVYNFGERNFIVEKLVSLLNSQDIRNSDTSIFKSYSICAEIIGEMCRLSELREHGKNGSLVMKARTFIHEKRLGPFSLNELSSSLGVCPEHLCREFKRHLNSSPKRYHEKLRMETICERLVGGESIKEVAGDFGFNDLSNFTKAFKKCCSMTPGQFKRNSALPLHDMFGM